VELGQVAIGRDLLAVDTLEVGPEVVRAWPGLVLGTARTDTTLIPGALERVDTFLVAVEVVDGTEALLTVAPLNVTLVRLHVSLLMFP
jgi:hypothetical protein